MKETDHYFDIGPYLKKIREKKNMSRSQLAEGICSVSYITRIENGERCPTSVILRQIAQKLGIASEDLFRAIESPSSLYLKEIIDKIFRYVAHYDFKSMYELIANEEENLEVLSIHDHQIIETVKYCCKALLENDYKSGLAESKKILELTYTKNSTPTDIEFLLLSIYGLFLLLNNQSEAAYNHLINLKKHVDNVKFIHSYVMFIRFYVYLILSCLDLSKLNEAESYIDYGINYCNEFNTIIVLRELYFLKGELFYRLGNKKEFKAWYKKASTLNDLIKDGDTDHFTAFLNIRLKKLKLYTLIDS